MAKSTGFDRYLDEQMRDPEFRSAYEAARARIDAVDRLVRSLDDAWEKQGLSKAELARRIGADPAAIRRLRTAPEPNPTMATFVSAADALGLEVRVAKKARSRSRGASVWSGVRLPDGPRRTRAIVLAESSYPRVVLVGEQRSVRLGHACDQYGTWSAESKTVAIEDAEQPVLASLGTRSPYFVEPFHLPVHGSPLASSSECGRGRFGQGFHDGDQVGTNAGWTSVEELSGRNRALLNPEESDRPRLVGG